MEYKNKNIHFKQREQNVFYRKYFTSASEIMQIKEMFENNS